MQSILNSALNESQSPDAAREKKAASLYNSRRDELRFSLETAEAPGIRSKLIAKRGDCLDLRKPRR
jgi:hypothetical protein